MSLAPNFVLISEFLPIQRRPFVLADPTILNPNGANPLLDGEWLEINSSYKAVRGSGASLVPTYPVLDLRGQSDTQAIQKATLAFLGMYEAETAIFDSTGLAVGDPLIVTDVTIASLTRRGLKKPTANGQHLVVAWCDRIVGSGASQRLRFVKQAPTYYTI